MRCCDECPIAPGFAWLGLGIACLKLEEYKEAEDAFTQANLLDERNAEVYCYLALLCLRVTKTLPGRLH
jgi:tetratricopeptide (TPR) repeat protein